MRECKKFMEALVNYEIVQLKDISDLTKMNKNLQQQVDSIVKF